MIPVKSDDTHVDTLPGKKKKFSIGNDAWVIQSLSDLYSNRELAVVREYSTNAYDANYEYSLLEGTDIQPIEVTLPSELHHFFHVRDYGYGMSEDTLLEVYTSFGDSTKRHSNGLNGMLGFGCKSAVAYTKTFRVISICEGMRTEAIITKSPDFEIEMTTLPPMPTDEPNGTEVIVPVHNHVEFNHKARDFYKFWLPGRVLVNGREPDHEVGEKIVDGLYYSKQWNTSYVVMGNVPYRIANPDALFRSGKMQRLNFVAYADTTINKDGKRVAAVEFTPSREDLKYTDHTKDSLQKIVHNFEDKIVAMAEDEIKAATTHSEAYTTWTKWCNVLGKALFGDLTFKGDKFEDEFKIKGHRYESHGGPYSTYYIHEWMVGSINSTLVVTDFEPSLSSAHKRKAKDYARHIGLNNVRYIIFTKSSVSDIDSPWVDTSSPRFVAWEDLKAALPKPPPKPRAVRTGPRRVKGTFDFVSITGWEYEKELPDDVSDLYYISIQDSKPLNLKNILTLLNSSATVVRLGQNRIAKFTRENPTVKEFTAWAKAQVECDGEKLLSDDAKRAVSFDYQTEQWLRRLDLSKVDDPQVKADALLLNKKSLREDYNRSLNLSMELLMYGQFKQYYPSKTISIEDQYPLLRELNCYGTIIDHTYLYMNAAYAAEQENKSV